MKTIRFFLNIILIFITLATNAQIYKIDGHVADSLTKQNLAFVNIVINNNGTLGTTTDIDGNFEIRSRDEIKKLTFSYVGYKSKKIDITEGGKVSLQIIMQSENIELQEVVVNAGENPAHRIIENVIRNRKRNNPENLNSYSYTIFDRMILTLDTTLITDTALMNINNFVRRSDLMIMETVSEKYHKKPNKNKKEIKANFITGLSNPMYFYVIEGMQSLSFYDDFIRIDNKDYVNPITPGSTSRYFFNIESEVPAGGNDTIFQISFKPRRGATFDGLRGVLTIHSDGWAVANVKAEPAVETKPDALFNIKFKIQQLYTKVNDSVWFPQQLNTDIEFLEMFTDGKDEVYISAKPGQANTVKLLGIGKSYISDIKVNEDISDKIFGNTDIDIADNSTEKDEDFWRQYRNDSMSRRVARTNAFVKRMEEKADVDFDKFIGNTMTIIEDGCIPAGPVDIRLNDILSYNEADGFYAGFGAKTNQKVSKRISVGAYGGYWFAAKKPNYGGNFFVRMDKKHNLDMNLTFDRKFVKVGDYGFSRSEYNALDESYFKYYYTKWTTLNTSLSAELSRRFGRIFQGFVKFSVSGVDDDYHGNRNDYWGQFKISKLDFRLRIAFGERLMGGPKGLVVVERGKPEIWVGYQKGMKGVFSSPHNFDKIQLQFSDYWKFRYIGKTSLTIQAGYVFGDIPFNEVFSMFGTGSGFGIYATESFSTMGPNEFFCDRFAALFFSHNFGRLFKSNRFRPEFIIVTNIGIGDLEDRDRYTSTVHDFKSIKDGYYESGLAIGNILDLGTSHVGFACMYRYGPYSFDKMSDNFAYKIKITFSF